MLKSDDIGTYTKKIRPVASLQIPYPNPLLTPILRFFPGQVLTTNNNAKSVP